MNQSGHEGRSLSLPTADVCALELNFEVECGGRTHPVYLPLTAWGMVKTSTPCCELPETVQRLAGNNCGDILRLVQKELAQISKANSPALLWAGAIMVGLLHKSSSVTELEHRAAVRVLKESLLDLRINSYIRRWIFDLLMGAVQRDDEIAQSEVVELLAESESADVTGTFIRQVIADRDALAAFRRIGASVVDMLTRQLDGPNQHIASYLLVQIGTPAVNGLITVMKNTNADRVRNEAAWALAQIAKAEMKIEETAWALGKPGSSAIRALKQVLNDPDERIRETAGWALEKQLKLDRRQ